MSTHLAALGNPAWRQIFPPGALLKNFKSCLVLYPTCSNKPLNPTPPHFMVIDTERILCTSPLNVNNRSGAYSICMLIKVPLCFYLIASMATLFGVNLLARLHASSLLLFCAHFKTTFISYCCHSPFFTSIKSNFLYH